MSLPSAQARLADAAKQLQAQWLRARDTWRDAASRAFEKGELEPLEANLRQAQAAMTQMQEVIHRAQRDCQP